MAKDAMPDGGETPFVPAHCARFKESAMYGITCGNNGKAWNVSLTRGGVNYHQAFTFSVYGGREQALVYAQAWRDEIARKHPPVSRRKQADQLRRNNKSGVAGVVALKNVQGKVTGWIAQTYLGPGQHVSKYFGIGRHGEADALRLAIVERQKQLAQMTGLRRVHPKEEIVRNAPSRKLSPRPERIAQTDRLLASNTTGIVGVTLLEDKKGRRRWIATTNVGQKRQLSKSFSVLTYGFEQAKALAIEARAEQLRIKRSAPPAKQGVKDLIPKNQKPA